MKYFVIGLLMLFMANVVEASVYYVEGYSRHDGTYVSGHYKTTANEYKWDNLSN